MSISLIETLCQGGCYWRRERADSPGHSIAVANGTAFKIAIEGPESHRFVSGKCHDGYFVVEEALHAGIKFNSANEAVNTVREPSSNAFLYIQFQINGRWILADDLRQSEFSQLDEAEELAIDDAIRIIRHHPKGKMLSPVEATMKAAQLVAKRPIMVEEARRNLAIIANIDLSSLGLG